MISMAEIDDVEDWLIDQSLGRPDLASMFAEMCEKLLANTVIENYSIELRDYRIFGALLGR